MPSSGLNSGSWHSPFIYLLDSFSICCLMLTLRSEFMATASGHCQELRSQTLAVSPPIPSSPAPTSSGLRHSQYLRPSHQAPPPRAQVSDTHSISAHPIKPRPHELRSQMLPVSPPIPSSPAPTSSGLRHSQYLRPSHQAPPPHFRSSHGWTFFFRRFTSLYLENAMYVCNRIKEIISDGKKTTGLPLFCSCASCSPVEVLFLYLQFLFIF